MNIENCGNGARFERDSGENKGTAFLTSPIGMELERVGIFSFLSTLSFFHMLIAND